jgi:hypothetical protein
MKRINNISRQSWNTESNCASRNAMGHTNVVILDPKQFVYNIPGDLS